jgi:hypothetical protein
MIARDDLIMDTFVRVAEARRRLGVSARTLRGWEAGGLLVAVRGPRGRRRLRTDSLARLAGMRSGGRRAAVYARVSSVKQQRDGNLERQRHTFVHASLRQRGPPPVSGGAPATPRHIRAPQPCGARRPTWSTSRRWRDGRTLPGCLTAVPPRPYGLPAAAVRTGRLPASAPPFAASFPVSRASAHTAGSPAHGRLAVCVQRRKATTRTSVARRRSRQAPLPGGGRHSAHHRLVQACVTVTLYPPCLTPSTRVCPPVRAQGPAWPRRTQPAGAAASGSRTGGDRHLAALADR